jgi:hypothetical protein
MHFEGNADQINLLLAALVAAQAEFPAIAKTKTAGAGSFSYKYAPLAEIQDKIRPILARHDLAVIHPLIRLDGKQTVATMLIHKGGGRMIAYGLAVPDQLKVQEQGALITYGSRYGYSSMLGISSEEDDEDRLGKSPRPKSSQPGKALLAPNGASPSLPDPALPTKAERLDYRKKLNEYRLHLEDDALAAFLLRASGASEVRLITKAQWNKLLAALDAALVEKGPAGLKNLVAGV